MKSLTIAMLMASLSAVSGTAFAEASYYGSIRVGIDVADDGNDTNTSLRNYASRLGFKAQTEINKDLTAFGHYEFGVDTDSSDNGNGATSTRKAYVGLKGAWGRVRLGQDYHTFYNFGQELTDQGNWDTCLPCLGDTSFRTGDAISYDGTFGNVSVGATGYAGDEEHGDGYELGIGGKFGPEQSKIRLTAAVRDTDGPSGTGDDPLWTVGAGGKFAGLDAAVSYFGHGDDNSVSTHFAYAGAYVNIGQVNPDIGDKTTPWAIGYALPLGEKTTVWFEYSDFDNDVTHARAALKYDF
ncbi:MAG: porin [Thiothrix sp.]|nr:porin [Thiothrix sp.]HPQ94775.1 porin [Thiolinea sp.]